MDSHYFIDAQFDRAVEIVQGLPKTGPIQTTYEEKLTMYSLYKQATVGNVKPPRPGIWDMLGRAKWDAWAKHKDLDPYEAKWLYVDAMLRVLRKYSDKTIAKDLVQELESYGGDPGNLVISRELSQSRGSDSSSSTSSDEHTSRLHHQTRPLATGFPNGPEISQEAEGDPDTTSEAAGDEANDHTAQSLYNRPPSSLSSRRYRTPMAGSMISPQPTNLPSAQQPSGFETLSAFAEPRPASQPPAVYPPGFYAGHYPKLTWSSPTHLASSGFREQPMQIPGRSYGTPTRPASRPTLERAIENVQAHLAALNERLESLESMSGHPHQSSVSLPTRNSSPRFRSGGLGSPADRGDYEWDLDDLGMWSLILSPVTRVGAALRLLARFFATSEHSPTLIIVRRLCLDASFLFCVLWILRSIWRKTGMRRREVTLALKILGRAILGRQQERNLVNRGV